MRGRKSKFKESEIINMIDQLVAGAKPHEIQERFGISKSSLNYHLYIHPAHSKLYLKKKLKASEGVTEKKKDKKTNVRAGTRYTEEKKKEVLTFLFNNGHVSRTSDKFGISQYTIYRWLKQYHPEKYRKFVNSKDHFGFKLSDKEFLIKIMEDRKSGLSYVELSKKYGIRTGTLSNLFNLKKRIESAFEEGFDFAKKFYTSHEVVKTENRVEEEIKEKKNDNLFRLIVDVLRKCR